MSPESNSQHPWAYPSHDSPDVARLQSRLPPLLSAVAGVVDVIGFLSLGKGINEMDPPLGGAIVITSGVSRLHTR